MHSSYFLTLLSLATSSLAISVTSPSEGTTWSSSGSNTVTWTRVNTDPTTFAVTLVQQGVYKQTLADNVDGTKGSLVVTATLPTGSAFQVNLINSTQDLKSGILAQSAQFNITQSAGTSSASGTSSSTSSAGSAAAASPASTGTSTPTGTDIPNASDTAPNPTDSSAPTKSNAASPSIHHGGLMGILALVGLAFI